MEWQKNLYHHEETPPEGAWTQIATQLDEQPWELRKNLYDEEVIPPPANWNLIASQLETGIPLQESTKIIPFWRKRAGLAAAAMVSAVILVSAYYFLAKKDLIKASDIAASVIDSPKKPAASKPNTNEVAAAPSVSENQKQPEQKERTNNLPQRDEQFADVQPQTGATKTYPGSTFAIQSVDRYPKSARYSYNINSLNRYLNSLNRRVPAFQKKMNPPFIVVQDENGQLIRVSSKLKDVIYYLPQSDFYVDDAELPVSEMEYWQKIFSDWKKKADNSLFIPDGGSFFDIVGFIKMIQENK